MPTVAGHDSSTDLDLPARPGDGAVLADALFASALQRSDAPTASQVRQAVTTAIRAFGGGGCAGRVAQAYGEHPETAAPRMRWARAAVAAAFPGPGSAAASSSRRTPATRFLRLAG
jgi:hypothetical protein